MSRHPKESASAPEWYPVNADAERSILGAILMKPELLPACVQAGLEAEHFSVSSHREIFATLRRMHTERKPIDPLLVCEELDVDRIGGYAYLFDLDRDAIPAASHVLARCRIVQRLAAQRRLLAIAESMESQARQRTASPQEIAARVIGELTRMAAING